MPKAVKCVCYFSCFTCYVHSALSFWCSNARCFNEVQKELLHLYTMRLLPWFSKNFSSFFYENKKSFLWWEFPRSYATGNNMNCWKHHKNLFCENFCLVFKRWTWKLQSRMYPQKLIAGIAEISILSQKNSPAIKKRRNLRIISTNFVAPFLWWLCGKLWNSQHALQQQLLLLWTFSFHDFFSFFIVFFSPPNDPLSNYFNFNEITIFT